MATAIYLVIFLAILPTYSHTSWAKAMPAVQRHRVLDKRSYFDINCKGSYDKTIFARLDRVCQDCYSLYREPELHSLCRSECFNSEFFRACLKALTIQHLELEYQEMADLIGRK